MKRFVAALSLALFGLLNVALAGPGLVADVALSPMGDFKAKVDSIRGEAILEGEAVKAENIVVDLRLMTTGVSLRDKHAKEKYLEVEKYPEAKLKNASGRNGLGRALIEFHGNEKEVDGTYRTDAQFLYADFALKLSDFGISGIGYKGIGVDDTVQVHVTVPLKKKASK